MDLFLKSINYTTKNICCIGAGYVGGPTMAVIAKYCQTITINVVDINQKRINAWNSDSLEELPIYEPGLKEIIRNTRNKNLFFTNEIKKSIAEADIVFISVNTPTKQKGHGAGYACDLKWVEESARDVAKYSKGHTIVVEKSTLPVKTAELIKTILEAQYQDEEFVSKNKSFSVLSNPEFLSEGNAIKDLESPDRVLIGGEDENSINELSEIYKTWISSDKIIKTNLWSSELSKLSANAFLAQRISSINAISAICEKSGADVKDVSEAIGLDTRIGFKFLTPGPGFGGSCFKKDILNLVYLCNLYGLDTVANYWEQVLFMNNWQRNRISSLVVKKLFGTVSLKKILVLGFAFKANTNDTRESAASYITKDLIENGAKLLIHDPQVSPEQIEISIGIDRATDIDNLDEGGWIFINKLNQILYQVDAVLVLTEWEEYKDINWKRFADLMRKPSWVFDTRNIVNKSKVISSGINYWGLGDGNNKEI